MRSRHISASHSREGEERPVVEISDMTAVSLHPQLLNDNDTNSSGSTHCKAQPAIVQLKLLLSFVKSAVFLPQTQTKPVRALNHAHIGEVGQDSLPPRVDQAKVAHVLVDALVHL